MYAIRSYYAEHAGIDEELQMARDAWLAEPRDLGDLADRELALLDGMQQPEPARVAQCPKDRCELFRITSYNVCYTKLLRFVKTIQAGIPVGG